MTAIIANHHATRQRGIATALELLQPRAHRWVLDAAALRVAGVLEVVALLVGTLVRIHATQDRHLVGLTSEQWDVFGKANAIDASVDRLGRAHDLGVVRLRIKGVQVAHAALHIEVDDVARGRDLLQWRGVLACGEGLASELAESCDTEEGLRGLRHEDTAVELIREEAHGY